MKLLVLPDTHPIKISKEGQDWAFFRYWPPGQFHFDWISAHVIPGVSKWLEGRLLRVFMSQALKALWSEKDYDVVVAHGSRSVVGLAFLHRWLGRRAPKLVVFDIESLGRAKSGLKLRLIRWASEAIDAVIYHTRSQQTYYDAFLPALAGKTYYVPLGFGLAPKSLDWSETGRGDFILSLDTTAPQRREWPVLVEALQRVPSHPKLSIAGKTKWRRDDLGTLSPPANVELLPRMPLAELRQRMERCRFAVLPLPDRGHAHGQLSLMQCMAAGAPTIVSDTGDVRDYVRDKETAILYRTGDAGDLAAKITWALEHQEACRAIGRRAHEAIRDEFNDETFALRIFEIVSGVVGEASP